MVRCQKPPRKEELRMIDRDQLKVLYASRRLSDAEKNILEFVANDVDGAAKLGTKGIARACYASSATVTRLAKKLGYASSREMLFDLQRRANAPAGVISTDERTYLRYDAHDLAALHHALASKGTIGLSGQGYSGLIAQYMERKLIAFGCTVIQQRDLEAETIVRNFMQQLDAFIFVSKSGGTQIILDTARRCRKASVPVISFTGNVKSELAELSDAHFIIQDDYPFDIENVQPNFFFGYCLLAFEEILRSYAAGLK